MQKVVGDIAPTTICLRFNWLCVGLPQETEEDTGGDGGTDHTGHVGTHGMHEQVVGGVYLAAHDLGNARAVRYGGNTGIADERIDFLGGIGNEQVHQLDEQHAAGGGNHETQQAQAEDKDGLDADEFVRLRGRPRR